MLTDEEWRFQWAAMLEEAQRRVLMHIPDPILAHLYFLLSPIELGWKAGVFSNAKSVVIDLSPSQYIVRITSGPLIDEIQDIFQWGVGRTLDETWKTDSKAYFERIDNEDRSLSYDEKRSVSSRWRYCLSGPTGPRLNTPIAPRVFAKRMSWGVRTNAGFWVEEYDRGWPIKKPELYSCDNDYGMVVAAHLTPEIFSGLPFRETDIDTILDPPKRRIGERIVSWKTPEVIAVRWHEKDDLFPADLSVDDAFANLLKI